MSPVTLKQLNANDQLDISALQKVLESAPGYWKRIANKVIEPDAARGVLHALPEGKTLNDKFVFGVYQSDQIIGCVDLICGYPDSQTAMLGLLIISEAHQKSGLGRAAYQAAENIAMSWPGVQKMRIGVVQANDIVFPFWQSLGFVETGVRRPYEDNGVISENVVLEKDI